MHHYIWHYIITFTWSGLILDDPVKHYATVVLVVKKLLIWVYLSCHLSTDIITTCREHDIEFVFFPPTAKFSCWMWACSALWRKAGGRSCWPTSCGTWRKSPYPRHSSLACSSSWSRRPTLCSIRRLNSGPEATPPSISRRSSRGYRGFSLRRMSLPTEGCLTRHFVRGWPTWRGCSR